MNVTPVTRNRLFGLPIFDKELLSFIKEYGLVFNMKNGHYYYNGDGEMKADSRIVRKDKCGFKISFGSPFPSDFNCERLGLVSLVGAPEEVEGDSIVGATVLLRYTVLRNMSADCLTATTTR